MEFDFPQSVGLLVVVTALGTVALEASDVMPTDIVFTMVLPSMIIFAVVAFALGMKHGEFRATR